VKVVRVHLQAGKVVSSSDFVSGWLPPGATNTSSRWGRPVSLLVLRGWDATDLGRRRRKDLESEVWELKGDRGR